MKPHKTNDMKHAFWSYLVAAILLAGGGLYFYELFLSVERHSFFSFQSDYLSCFMPWNSHLNWYPGENYSLKTLWTAFSGQFYRGWGAVAYQVVAGLIFAFLLTFLCRHLWLKRGIQRLWKRVVIWILPIIWALVFLGCQLTLSFANYASYQRKGNDYRLTRILMKVERLITEQRYEDALQIANRYWFSHPCPIDDVVTGRYSLYEGLSQEEILFRMDLADYTRLALLGAHQLNDAFFAYYRVPEIYGQLENGGTPTGFWVSAFRNRLIGNHTIAYSQLMTLMETEGMSYSLLDMSIFSSLICHQYGLADKYIRLLENTLFYRKKALLYRNVSEYLQHPEKALSTQGNALAEQILQERKKVQTDYIYTNISEENNARELWKQRPAASLENLEYISLIDLLYKRTDSVMARIGDYLHLSEQKKPPYRLPSAWQEMLLVMLEENHGEIPAGGSAYLNDILWDEALVKQCRLFYMERERLRRGMSTPRQITESFGHTFAYNYYYSRFVNIERNDDNSLSH